MERSGGEDGREKNHETELTGFTGLWTGKFAADFAEERRLQNPKIRLRESASSAGDELVIRLILSRFQKGKPVMAYDPTLPANGAPSALRLSKRNAIRESRVLPDLPER